MNLSDEGKALIAKTFPDHVEAISAELRSNALFLAVTAQLAERIATLEAGLEGVLKVRPENWDDDEDPEQVEAWAAAAAALAQTEGNAP